MWPLYQYADHVPALPIWVPSIGPVEDRDPALIPRLHHDVAPGNRNQGPIVRDAVLVRRLRREHLVIALELHLAVLEREQRVRAPVRVVVVAALGLPAAAPLVREQDLGAGVVERRGVPVREV